MPELLYVANMRLPSEKAHSVHVMEMCAALADEGLTVSLLVPTRRTAVIAEDVHGHYGVPKSFGIVRCPSLDAFRVAWLPRRIAFAIHAWTFARAVAAEAARHPKDALILSRDAYVAARLARQGRRVAFEVHDLPGPRAARLLRTIPKIVVTNDLKRQRLVADVGIPAERILVAPNAVDAARFRADPAAGARFREELGIAVGRPLVLYTGHLYAWKGVETLARAAAMVRAGHPDAKVVFVGGSPGEQAAFRGFLEREGLVPHVRLVPHRPHADIPGILAAADVLVLPTSGRERMGAIETSPLKAFEYLASGKPIVASDLPSSHEAFGEAGQVAYFASDDPRDCARAIGAAIAASPSTAAPEPAPQWTWRRRAHTIVAFLRL